MLKLERLVVGRLFGANCFILSNTDTGEAILVDPGAEGEYIVSRLEKDGLVPAAIWLTHGHYDHIGAVAAVREAFDVPVAAAAAERELLADPVWNLSAGYGPDITLEADIQVRDGDILRAAGLEAKVISVPGHTPGGICFYLEAQGILFSGDSLFAGSVGRTDFPGGSHEQLIRGLKEKVLTLPDKTRVFPGHGPETTIKEEKQDNPYLR